MINTEKNNRDYIQDVAEIRSMMERSSKFMSLSGWAGVMAGIYALTGSYIARQVFGFHPDSYFYQPLSLENGFPNLPEVIFPGMGVLFLSVVTALILSRQKAKKRGFSSWNATSKRLLSSISVPLFSGGILILIVAHIGLVGLMIPLSLIFYGLALFQAGQFTFNDIRYLGLIQIVLGLLSSYFISHSLLLWMIGFGGVHIVYGIVIYLRYER